MSKFDHHIAIPFAVDLAHLDGWECLDDNLESYFAGRLYVYLKHDGRIRPIRRGEILCDVTAPESVASSVTIEKEVEVTKLSHKELIGEWITSLVETHNAISAIGAKLSPALGSARAEMSSEIRDQLSITAREHSTFSQSQVRRRRQKVTQSMVIDKDTASENHLVATYRESDLDAFLTGFDFLFVTYAKPRRLSFHKRRLKQPEHRLERKNGKVTASNFFPLNQPLARLRTWTPLGGPFPVVAANDYKPEIPVAGGMEVAPPERMTIPPTRRMRVPSLYEVSNGVFDLKHSKFMRRWAAELERGA